MVPIIASSAYVDGVLTIENVPDILEPSVLSAILEQLGARVRRDAHSLSIDARELHCGVVSDAFAGRIHGSLYLVPTLLGRLGVIDIGMSGGCPIGDPRSGGARPWRHVCDVLEKFGARFDHAGGRLRGRCDGYRAASVDILEFSDSATALRGARVSGATKTALLAAAVARGTTVIKHPYRRPDSDAFIEFLRESGIEIEDQGDWLLVEGRSTLRATRHRLMPDLIEVVTFIACAAHHRAYIALRTDPAVVRRWLAPELAYMEQMGVPLEWAHNRVTVRGDRLNGVRAVDITASIDSIYSDSLPFFVLMLLSADRSSVVRDVVWGHRFDYVAGLQQLGCNFESSNDGIRVLPARPSQHASDLRAYDLRSAAVLLLASLGIPGTRTISGTSHLARGYEDLDGKLRGLGACLRTSGAR